MGVCNGAVEPLSRCIFLTAAAQAAADESLRSTSAGELGHGLNGFGVLFRGEVGCCDDDCSNRIERQK